MPTRAWRGFWNSLGCVAADAASRLLSPRRRAPAPRTQAAPWQAAANRRRAVFALLTLLSSVVATTLFANALPPASSSWLAGGQIALFAILSTWVVTGFITALMGFWVALRGDAHTLSARSVQHHSVNPAVRTAVIMPICHEDVATVFAGLRATCESLAKSSQAAQFDVFVLSDSHDPAVLAAERAAWEALRLALATSAQAPVEVYYRRRTRRTHRKAGNVADFCRRWGRDYRYMVVLDADSVMSGDCLVSMVKLMEAHPQAGIIQTATQSIGHATLHARAQQFAARVTGRLFTLGMQFWQLGESHYWGHNAILRVEPFMRHCGLAPLAGRGGLCGGILSHDFVEAALMRRAGYHVWLVSDLTGSYEQQPPDLLSELQRDRRWCQGNLQNARLIAEPGLHRIHRAMFAVGAMSYVSAPLWFAFLLLGVVSVLDGGSAVQGLMASGELAGLWAWTLCLLFLPRVLGVVAVVLQGTQKSFGGTANLLRSAVAETVLAMLQAPVRMLAHSLFVTGALTGLKLDWKSPPREAQGLSWRDAAARLTTPSAGAAAVVGAAALLNAHMLPALLPVALPLLLAVPLAVWTGDVQRGARLRAQGWLLVPEEAWSPAVLRRAWRHASRLVQARAA